MPSLPYKLKHIKGNRCQSCSHNFLYWILEHERSDIFVHCLFSGLVIQNLCWHGFKKHNKEILGLLCCSKLIMFVPCHASYNQHFSLHRTRKLFSHHYHSWTHLCPCVQVSLLQSSSLQTSQKTWCLLHYYSASHTVSATPNIHYIILYFVNCASCNDSW